MLDVISVPPEPGPWPGTERLPRSFVLHHIQGHSAPISGNAWMLMPAGSLGVPTCRLLMGVSELLEKWTCTDTMWGSPEKGWRLKA